MRKIVIGETIKKLRESMSLSQDELGEILEVSGKTISSWEISRTEPNMGYVQKLSNYFNVSMDYLIYGKNSSVDSDVSFDDFRFALYGEVKDLTEEQKQDVLDFARFIKNKNK
ncbi:XRE family transcriptional regulator [Anaerorhabdus furcosa]|uniref:DNA-binding transcriptional regulator, XRE-family HTH domain n=1 Tax=Anaerorhabdus furcosa TaxID=118967 RepID=A0A1T4LYW2_9FIRM|nr:XRE family transcriptional regulator [Anaerorhabdus furcosa]SJZ59855.1 DNA-binding transcriptional regulator, XRE-family HTH domain [Anaerorhabdus furcosa]